MHLLSTLLTYSFLTTPQHFQKLRERTRSKPVLEDQILAAVAVRGDLSKTNVSPASSLDRLPNQINQPDCNGYYYTAHEAPKSTYLILNSPAIASFVLVEGWTDQSLETFTYAVNTVVQENPVLTGRAICPDNWYKHPHIDVLLGEFQPQSHSFVKTIDLSHKKSLSSLQNIQSPADRLDYIEKYIAPHVDKVDSTLQQIHKKSPLFDVSVVLLPDHYACIYSKMSHCVGDLVTYYKIMDQISCIDKGELDHLHPINWDNPLKANHEIFPDSFSTRDLERLYGIPFILGVASHFPTMPFRKKKYVLLNDDKIKCEKAKLHTLGVSSNDIITAALCDANRSTDIFALTRSMRGVTPGLSLRDGGNLHVEIPFHRCAGRNPLVIKDIIDKGRYFEPDEVPLWESLTGRVGRISNCVAPVNRFSFGGCQPICYCPAKSFLDFTPLDTAIIFRVSKGQTAVLHNFREMNEKSELLNSILE